MSFVEEGKRRLMRVAHKQQENERVWGAHRVTAPRAHVSATRPSTRARELVHDDAGPATNDLERAQVNG